MVIHLVVSSELTLLFGSFYNQHFTLIINNAERNPVKMTVAFRQEGLGLGRVVTWKKLTPTHHRKIATGIH